MAKREWTKPQSDAITARGGSLLVSAAAGSGKTAVLVERAVGLLCDPREPVDADQLLVVTFSRAAAAEMKQRMSQRLGEMIRKDPANLHLQRQQALLAGAQISTVDSFCLDLVRQNFQDLSISPDFSILDQNELEIMQRDCVADCIAECYEGEEGPALQELVELLSAGRDDRQLAETILKIYGFSQSHPFFDEWLETKLRMYAPGRPVEQTVWGGAILDYTRESLDFCLELTRSALALIPQDEKMQKAYEAAFLSDLHQLERCAGLARDGDWDGAVTALRGFTFAKLGPLRGEDSLKERVKSARDRVKAAVKELGSKYMNATGEEFREDLEDLRPKIELLFRLVRDFSARLWELKTHRKRLHFADLEHLALQLLVERCDEGYRPTARALEIAGRYAYVLVDEYQDTNEVQDMIFTCVSRRQSNLFMVGDVKQSIYAFRQAMPEIFMAKKAAFFPYDTGEFPAKVLLDTNFRSRPEVTGAVNSVFAALMSEACGDVDYNDEERLRCGARYESYSEAYPELLLVEAGTGDDAAALEARQIALRIRRLLESGYCVQEGGGSRPVELRDICILMRSPKNRAELYVKALAEQDVAATAESAGGYLSTREISAVVSLLRALDNPLLDVELVAAMLSPLFDFTADDIARIRLAAKGKPFFTAIGDVAAGEAASLEEWGTKAKAAAFLETFARLRAEAAVLPADRLIMRLYEETDALAVFQAMGMGTGRRANLLLLIEYAGAYHEMGYKQLGGFVGFLGRLTEREGDLAPAGNLGDGANTVRIMSIHRSKGLEFPVVFLADMAKNFNKVDLRQNTLLHSKFGFACVRRDYASLKQFPTVPMQAIRLAAQRSILSEEMRILYVALTRAREKLILTGCIKKDMKKKLSGLCGSLQAGRIPAYAVGGCACYLDWILLALLHHPAGEPLRQIAQQDEADLIADDTPWHIAVIPAGEQEADGGAAGERPMVKHLPDQNLLDRLHRDAAWEYPYLNETTVPGKLSVSAVAKGEQDIQYRFTARPRFMTRQKLTPAERGNAMHKFMQFASYESARDGLEAEIKRMEDEQFLSAAECDSLQRDKLAEFFASALAGRIFASNKVYRELKFTAECGQDMLGEIVQGIGDSKVVLQGVADCVFLEEDGAVIVDYKTDRVPDMAALRQRYAQQLALYRAILSQSLELPVKGSVLYSFHLSCEVKI